ncbi:molybdopterin molybdotransferase MoeA [Methanotorris igneus]|uniref:Molybdenum cofactor synthesis domain protein n=1 Tax=Methanotorris igneus (strain DSM 5666 / JCM 11834 / Kol 5) TaxID=880724 RepID=F6BAR5_METIK|nr:molybdopterin molybdotransferase MoeA [Methanotorris igneus]AEF95879.1 molybdenum cofactor synthesis domain protein [Methanotorris igneus Kol 5]
MISVREAEKILSKFYFNKTEYIKIEESYGRVLAEDIISNIDIPRFDRSDIDGYAVAEILEEYILIDEVFAGDDKDLEIKGNECVSVATGGKVPKNTKYVIPVENTIKIGNKIVVINFDRIEGISKKGCDVKKGDIILKKGTLINERNIGVLACLGIEEVKVYKTPKVGIISTGNELFKMTKDINSKTIASIVKKAGCEPIFLGIARDDPNEIKEHIIEASKKCDIIVTSGGVSIGKKDFLPRIVDELGEILFHKVKMRPGMPILFGKIDKKPIFCMPGNIVSCLVCSYVFLLPLLMKMAHKPYRRKIIKAKLSEKIISEPDFLYLWPVKLKNGIAYPTFKGSNMLTSILNADGLSVIKEHELKKDEGDMVDVWIFE